MSLRSASCERDRSRAAWTTRARQSPGRRWTTSGSDGISLPSLDSRQLLALVTGVAVVAAFLRDMAEHATVEGALVTAGIEAAAVVGGFLVLSGALGLRATG